MTNQWLIAHSNKVSVAMWCVYMRLTKRKIELQLQFAIYLCPSQPLHHCVRKWEIWLFFYSHNVNTLRQLRKKRHSLWNNSWKNYIVNSDTDERRNLYVEKEMKAKPHKNDDSITVFVYSHTHTLLATAFINHSEKFVYENLTMPMFGSTAWIQMRCIYKFMWKSTWIQNPH